MRFLIISLLMMSFLASSCKKDLLSWKQIEKIDLGPGTERLNEILFLNDSIGIVAGGERFTKGLILLSTDTGRTWSQPAYANPGKGLYGISLTSDNRLYIAGFDGKLLRSDDWGQNWSLYQSHYLPLKDVYFFTRDRGIVVGGVSFDQGFYAETNATGNAHPYDSSGFELNNIEMADPSSGYIACYGGILGTTDSGRHWAFQNAKNDNFTSVCILDKNEAWACGYNGSIVHTTDGGENWEQLRNGNDVTLPAYRLHDILFTDPLHGYAVGEKGIVIVSDDGGHHWMEFEKFTGQTLRSISKASDGSLFICGDNLTLFRVWPAFLP
ncbi:MAG: hypothetical protein EOP49_03205 [Sphingobacteriales bacterium]|nr:MAG: hypothetical protein EOP49_03205 [Sphingobacteriales bacterium]